MEKKKGIFIHNKIGYNFMFTELQAAMGHAQLDKLKKIIKFKLASFKKYRKELGPIKKLNS